MNLPLVFIYKLHKEEIQLQLPGEPREHCIGEVLQGRWTQNVIYYLFFLKSFFDSYLQVASDKYQNQPPGEPREHHTGEVLQGRSKSKLDSFFFF